MTLVIKHKINKAIIVSINVVRYFYIHGLKYFKCNPQPLYISF
ncbi:hypothetical protein T190607A02C_60180 [Tenacibaculum sp. 190524A02b]